MVPTGNPADALIGAVTYHWSLVDNIKRDPFEMATGQTQGIAVLVGRWQAQLPPMSMTGTYCPSASSCGLRNWKPIFRSHRYRIPSLTT